MDTRRAYLTCLTPDEEVSKANRIGRVALDVRMMRCLRLAASHGLINPNLIAAISS